MAERWQIHTVVFDLDDTLYPERDYVYSGFAAVDAYLREQRGIGGFAAAARTVFDQGLRGRVFDEVLPGLGLPAEAGLIQDLVRVYREHRPTLRLFPDAVDVLEWLRGKCRLGLITDGYAVTQQRKVAALGLERLIPHRILTDELGRECWKPSPVAFRKMMEWAPGPVSGYVYVGDNPTKDFLPAKALGWRTVRVARPGGEHATTSADSGHDAEASLDSLAAFLDLLCPSPVGSR